MSKRTILGGVTLALLSPLALLASPAAACACPDEGIAVKASDATPASGQTVRLRGVWIQGGKPAVGRTVKVQTRRDGAWESIRGAVVTTNADGEYGVRVILSQKGKRTMRVVGVKPGPDVTRSFVLRVH